MPAPHSEATRRKALSLYRQGHGTVQVGEILGVSASYVAKVARQEGIIRGRGHPKYTREEVEQALQEAGYIAAAGVLLGTSERGAWHVVRRLGLLPPKDGRTLGHGRLYPPETRELARKLRRQGLTWAEIEARTGAHRSTMRRWLAEGKEVVGG